LSRPLNKWRRADISAESALKLAATEIDTATTDEGHLLRAEIRRLGADAAQADLSAPVKPFDVAERPFATPARRLGCVVGGRGQATAVDHPPMAA
jgi:hypothetical protein